MTSVNKVTLIGNVGQDPKINTFPSGGKVASFSIATSESWKDKATGERKTRTEWHNVNVTNESLIKVVESYVKKGSKLYVEGQLETRKFTTTAGVEKTTTEVALRPFRGEIVLLDKRDDAGQETESAERAEAAKMLTEVAGGINGPAAVAHAAVAAGKAAAPERNKFEDEMPF